MRKDYSNVLKYLSNKVHDLLEEICEYSKDLPEFIRLNKLSISNLTKYFKSDNNIIEKCENLLTLMNLIDDLKDVCKKGIQKEFCLYISKMTLDTASIFTNKYKIKYDDFEPIYKQDYERITTEMNDLYKLDWNDSEETHHKFLALLYSLEDIHQKNNDDLLDKYMDCVGWNLIHYKDDNETRTHIINSNYLLYSVFKKDYEGDKQLYNTFVKS